MATYALGIDVGSTTVKYVLCDAAFRIIAKAYTPHDTKQAAKLLQLLETLSQEHPVPFASIERVYITGSGASRIAPTLKARFVQEVNAVVLAVEQLYPDVRSVVELGGQDAKVIHFKEGEDGKKTVTTAMNDKCASGTGATIEKCTMKVGLDLEALQQLHYSSAKLHHVAAKCGVFAETDIVNLVKSSIPADEIINSLADAIVMQNLTLLTRGNTLMPKVLLLGGPNTYLPFLQEAWRERIAQLWDERGVTYDPESLESLVIVPENAQYYAALGAVIFGEGEANHTDTFGGLLQLRTLVESGGIQAGSSIDLPLVQSSQELEAFKDAYALAPFEPVLLHEETDCYLGIDGGSTSSKAVLVDEEGRLLLKVYQLSKGNPIQDTIELLEQIHATDTEGHYRIKGMGATGYAADVLEGALGADVNIIETIAHMKSAQAVFGEEIDVICDIGGQDIKVLFLENGMMKNFRLSNQCSAGNGTLLQSMAKQFGVPVEGFAEVAFSAQQAPKFNYGCAVFLDTDRVNFQKEGYSKEELFAGIAKVLPKNVWQYVVQATNLAALGKHFVLQGGTQYNLAALKAQVDYIKALVPDAQVDLHPYPGEAGAYGAAIEAREVVARKGHSSFVGMAEALQLTYTSRTDESTRCHFCPMDCSRTFIDTQTPNSATVRYIAGFSCESGTVESAEALQQLKTAQRSLQKEIPDLVKKESKEIFLSHYTVPPLPSDKTTVTQQRVTPTLGGWGPTFRRKVQRHFARSSQEAAAYRHSLRIAIPRVLNIYSVAPFLRTYLEALGLPSSQIHFSGFTNEEMYLEGAKYGSVDACYPAKVAQSHVYSLLFDKRKYDYLWFPSVVTLSGFISDPQAETSCPIVAGTPRVVYSAFIKEQDLFAKAGLEYIDDTLTFDKPKLLKKELFALWGEKLHITRDESDWAAEQAISALKQSEAALAKEGKAMLERAEAEGEIVILLLGRPYHSDPGINHEVLSEFQALGYKSLSMRAIPKEEAYLRRYFGEEVEAGSISSVFDIRDVWPENYSTNSAQKVWAAKFAARHPNVAVVDLSSFKCGHDAPTYAIIDKILGASRTPHLTLHDIDANKPGGSIKIRVRTFAYALEQLVQEMKAERQMETEQIAKTEFLSEKEPA